MVSGAIDPRIARALDELKGCICREDVGKELCFVVITDVQSMEILNC